MQLKLKISKKKEKRKDVCGFCLNVCCFCACVCKLESTAAIYIMHVMLATAIINQSGT